MDRALTKLYDGRGTRLWVVYVNNFGGLKPFRWAEDTMRANGFADTDAILAVATDQPVLLLPGAQRGDPGQSHRSRDHSPRPDRAGRFPP